MTQLETILQRQVTRKEFLTTLGFGLASLFGFSTILRLVFGRGQTRHVAAGYGGSTYGGHK